MRVSIYHTKEGYTGIIKPLGVGTDERELTVLDRDGKEIAHSYSCMAENYFEFIEAVENIVEMRKELAVGGGREMSGMAYQTQINYLKQKFK